MSRGVGPRREAVAQDIAAVLANAAPEMAERLHQLGTVMRTHADRCESGLAACILNEWGSALREPHERYLQLGIFG